jgi:Gpi18-like mannosyltransferase
MKGISAIQARLQLFWGQEERLVLAGNLAVHLLVQLFALIWIPLADFSELSIHDGAAYYRISQNLFPVQPLFGFHWHKRILLPLLANFAFPWERHISFLVIGIGAASLSAVFFYKIAAKYTQHPVRLTVIYSALPWLFFSAHLGLTEPLLLLFLLAGYYYFLEDRPWGYTLCLALALLSKETAVLPIMAMTILIWKRHGWKRVAVFLPAVLPFGIFCLAYGYHWNDCLWCARNTPDNSFTWQSGLWWMVMGVINGIHSTSNPAVTFLYNLVNQILNLSVLVAIGTGIFRLRKTNFDLMLFSLLVTIPLFFLGRNVYTFNPDMGRQFLISCLVILGFDNVFQGFPLLRSKRIGKYLFFLLLTGMFGLSYFWILLHSGYFVSHKIF